MNETERERGWPGAWSRRELIRALGLSSSGMLLLGPTALLGSSAASAAPQLLRSPADPIRAALELDGQSSYLLSVAGGNPIASIAVAAATGPGAIPNKHPSGIAFEDIVLGLPLLASPTLAGWINDSLSNGFIRKSGAIAYADAQGNVLKRLQFSDALLTEIDLPACDATQNNPAVLVLRLAPETTQWTGGTGKLQVFPLAPRAGATLAGNFQLSIQGLEAACQAVALVSSLTAKRTVQSSPVGQARFAQITNSPFDIATLSITLAESRAAPFFTWFNNFTLKGNIGPGAELPGVLQWFAADHRTVSATAQLVNLGVVRYAPEPFSSDTATIGRVQVDMYCEAISLTLPSA